MRKKLGVLGDQMIDCPYCDNRIKMRYTEDGLFAFCDNCHILVKGDFEHIGYELSEAFSTHVDESTAEDEFMDRVNGHLV